MDIVKKLHFQIVAAYYAASLSDVDMSHHAMPIYILSLFSSLARTLLSLLSIDKQMKNQFPYVSAIPSFKNVSFFTKKSTKNGCF